MKILFFGDIVGRPGREALAKILPDLKKEFEADLVLANAENVSHGQGISEKQIDELLSAGVDYMTSGDHTFALAHSDELLNNKNKKIIRPFNWPGGVAGRGFEIINIGTRRLMLVNLVGRVFMSRDFDDPFKKIEELLDDYSLKGKEQGSEAVDAIIVDLHAEATSEKIAMGWFLDGRVSALVGSHTHVQTADEKRLPQGTAYISDLGMCGPSESVLGADKDIVIKRFLTQRMFRMETSSGRQVEIGGVFIETDDQTGLAKKIERIRKAVVLE